jgi:hypothetical protein
MDFVWVSHVDVDAGEVPGSSVPNVGTQEIERGRIMALDVDRGKSDQERMVGCEWVSRK